MLCTGNVRTAPPHPSGIADLALAAATKLVEGKMDDAENRNLVDAFLKEEGVNS